MYIFIFFPIYIYIQQHTFPPSQERPTHIPTVSPSEIPSFSPTEAPTDTPSPTVTTEYPTSQPTIIQLTLSKNVIWGSVLLYLSSSLSAAGGLGGGALNVPILWLLWGFSFHTAVILSLCTLSGNYLMQVAVNFTKRHPLNSARPLIYWDIILILLPAELGGANLGVILR